MQQVRGRAVSTRPRRAKTLRTSGVSSLSPRRTLCEPPVRKSPNNDATRRRMAQKSPCRAESAVLLRGAAGTSGAQKLVTRPTGRPEGGTTATGGAQRAGIALAAFLTSSGQRPMGAGAVCEMPGLAVGKTLASKPKKSVSEQHCCTAARTVHRTRARPNALQQRCSKPS